MGVEYYFYCEYCKTYADCHKIYTFANLYHNRKHIDETNDEGGPKTNLNNYWSQKAMVYLLKHWGHKIGLTSDHNDDCWDILTHKTEDMKDWCTKNETPSQ